MPESLNDKLSYKAVFEKACYCWNIMNVPIFAVLASIICGFLMQQFVDQYFYSMSYEQFINKIY